MRLVSRVEPSLLDKAGLEGWLEYETRINFVLSKFDDPVICAYDLSNFSANVVMDMLRVHPRGDCRRGASGKPVLCSARAVPP